MGTLVSWCPLVYPAPLLKHVRHTGLIRLMSFSSRLFLKVEWQIAIRNHTVGWQRHLYVTALLHSSCVKMSWVTKACSCVFFASPLTQCWSHHWAFIQCFLYLPPCCINAKHYWWGVYFFKTSILRFWHNSRSKGPKVRGLPSSLGLSLVHFACLLRAWRRWTFSQSHEHILGQAKEDCQIVSVFFSIISLLSCMCYLRVK